MTESLDAPVSFWQAPSLSSIPWLAHGITHRTGGVSAEPYDSLNLGLHVSDDRVSVCANRERVATALGFTAADMVTAEQVHGGKVAAVALTDMGTRVAGVDGLVTNVPNVLLALFFADCVPVLFADEERKVVGVAHAGWRGIVAGVLEETLVRMRRVFDCRPETLWAAIGPCIGPCCFEVGEEVADAFPGETVRRPEWPRPHVDLATAAKNRLRSAGIASERIVRADECTSCLPERYFSHRRDNGRTGRMAAFIGIHPD